MKNYLLLFRGGLNYETASPEQLQQSMLHWKNWIEQLAKEDKFTGGERLNNPGAVIKGTKKQVVDGPYTEGKEVIGGYFSIKASNMEEAIEIAKGCPIFAHQNGSTEVREIATM